jgi:hypothetical protein
MLKAGDGVPFFEATDTSTDRQVSYRDLWQRKNLLLVTVPDRDPAFQMLVARLNQRMAELTAHETAVVITSDGVEGMPVPGVLVADRWGEIFYVAGPAVEAPVLLEPEELIEWLRYIQQQCPECQGEAR